MKTKIQVLENRDGGKSNCFFQIFTGDKLQVKKFINDNLVREKSHNSLFFLPKDEVKKKKGFLYLIDPID